MELKVLESLAYSSAEPAVLLNLLGNIKKLQTDIGSSLSHAEGLLLQPVSLLKTAQKIKQKYKRLINTAASYSSLEPTSKRGESSNTGNCSELVSRLQNSRKQQQQKNQKNKQYQ